MSQRQERQPGKSVSPLCVYPEAPGTKHTKVPVQPLSSGPCLFSHHKAPEVHQVTTLLKGINYTLQDSVSSILKTSPQLSPYHLEERAALTQNHLSTPCPTQHRNNSIVRAAETSQQYRNRTRPKPACNARTQGN